MSEFTNLPNEEIERRRMLTIEAMEQRGREDFERWYQEECDRFYWRNGPCCAGCDHWSSDRAWLGQCMSAPPISGRQLLASLKIISCSYEPPPGQPYTERDHVCGAFKDDFDWPSLGEEYLQRIGYRA